MRVAMVCPYDMAVPGGVQSQVDGLAAALTRIGDEVVVIAPDAIAAGEPGGTGQATRTYRFVGVGESVSVAANGSKAPVAPGLRAMSRTLQALKASSPDVVHIHEPLAPGSSLAALARARRPIVATFHRAGADFVYRTEGKVLRRLARHIGAPIAVSEAARATAVEVLGRRFAEMQLIPNGVEVPSDPGRSVGRPGPPEGFVVAFVGRHEQRKGLEVLLKAFARLERERPELQLKLRIVGDGPDSDRLRQGYKGPSISWLGAVADETRLSVLQDADVFVAPSVRGESFGVVLLEAMAAGTPVIASDLPGYQVAGGEAARYFTAGSDGELAAVLAVAACEPEASLSAWRTAGLSRARLFSIDELARRYHELYASLLAGAAAS